jgi:hypothetical protein
MWLLIILFSPVILIAGEPVNRYVMRRVRRDAAPVTGVTVAGHGGRPALVVESSQLPLPVFLLSRATSDPLWIALTAPGRWVGDRFRRPPARLTRRASAGT